MSFPQTLQAPKGFQWILRQIFGHGFWRGFGAALFLTPLLMTLISFSWNGSISDWNEQFKSFIIGDPLLALIIGLLAYLARKPSATEYTPKNSYWCKWLIVGAVSSAVFITNDIRKHVLHLSMVLEPHLFYHHIFIITFYVSALGGMGYVQYRRHPRSSVWLYITLLFLCYMRLVVLDYVHPPIGVTHFV